MQETRAKQETIAEDKSIYGIPPSELAKHAERLGFPAFRGTQLAQGLYNHFAERFDDVKNIPDDFRAALAADGALDLDGTAKLDAVAGDPGGTRKLLLLLADGQRIETVIIPARDGRTTVCVSSQAGCACDCAFCASGKRGLVRSLSTGEILAQVIRAAIVAGAKPSNIVFMGIGEPFMNYDSVIAAARAINAKEGLGIGARKITISTCGIIPGIRRLMNEGAQFELSVSLHAPTDELRSMVMPINRRYPLRDLMEACREYTAKTNRIITFEYTLIRGFNDRPSSVRALVRLLKGLNCRVNLIPLSPVSEFDGEAPPQATLYAFRDALNSMGVNATLRVSKGKESNAACGQLRLSRLGPRK